MLHTVIDCSADPMQFECCSRKCVLVCLCLALENKHFRLLFVLCIDACTLTEVCTRFAYISTIKIHRASMAYAPNRVLVIPTFAASPVSLCSSISFLSSCTVLTLRCSPLCSLSASHIMKIILRRVCMTPPQLLAIQCRTHPKLRHLR